MLASHWLSLLLTVELGCATLSKGDRKKKSKEKATPEKQPIVNETGPTLTAKDVLENHSKYKAETSEKNFIGDVLGYVTPWNSHGYSTSVHHILKAEKCSTKIVATVWSFFSCSFKVMFDPLSYLWKDVLNFGPRGTPGWQKEDILQVFWNVFLITFSTINDIITTIATTVVIITTIIIITTIVIITTIIVVTTISYGTFS